MRTNAPQLPGGEWAQLELTDALVMAFTANEPAIVVIAGTKAQRPVFSGDGVGVVVGVVRALPT